VEVLEVDLEVRFSPKLNVFAAALRKVTYFYRNPKTMEGTEVHSEYFSQSH